MTKEKLMQYCNLEEEIDKLEKRIDRIEKQSEMVSDVVQNGYKRHAVIYGFDCRRSLKLQELEHILKQRRERLLDLQIEIEEWIDTIPDSDIRQIFEHRYIDNMSWIQVQIAMSYNNENTARLKHDRFLEKIS